jgi:iron(III) transport system ATP-binding protein
MADRVVVMNQGGIDQVGSPSDVYERPETPFVADFLGKVNVLKGVALGGGRYRVGTAELLLPAGDHGSGQDVRIYVRPEDRHVEGNVASLPNRLRGRIARIDYLGTFCLAELRCEAIGQPMLISYSLNQLHDLKVREGGEVEIALRVDRVRVFADQAVGR